MPIVNTMAFLFTVLGEWYVDGKVISRGETKLRILLRHFSTVSTNLTADTGIGMALSLVGIALCVHSKT